MNTQNTKGDTVRKKRKKPSIFTIDLDVFDAQVLIAMGATESDITNFIKKNSEVEPSAEFLEMLQIDQNDSQMGRSIFDSETNWKILWLRHYPKTPYEYGILAHEASHIAHFILENMGVEWSAENDEVVCYTVGYIVKEALSHT